MAQPKFQFPLEALLAHREQVEKDCQRKVAAVQQEAQRLGNEIRDAEARIIDENRTLTGEKLVGRLDMQYIAHEKRFVGNLHMKIAMTLQRLAATEQKLAAVRAELLAAARARKVIEKLREKQHARWRAEQDRKEADLLDEIGTQGALRDARQRQLDEHPSAEANTPLARTGDR